MVRLDPADIPVNPERLPVVPSKKVPVVIVSVPLPDRVPFTVTALAIVGLAPIGIVHPELIVFRPVLVKVAVLSEIPLQAIVAAPPEKVTVPLL